MLHTLPTDDVFMILRLIDDKIFDLREEIGEYHRLAEESEDISFKRSYNNLADFLEKDRMKYVQLRSRLMRSGR